MSKRIYNKPPKTFQEQLQQIKDRNLTVEDDVKALSILTNISYYRLSAYFLPYQSKKDWFDNDTTFKQIIDTYSFDRELRLLVFDCIERIEVAIRTQFIYGMAIHYNDSHWQDKTNFNFVFLIFFIVISFYNLTFLGDENDILKVGTNLFLLFGIYGVFRFIHSIFFIPDSLTSKYLDTKDKFAKEFKY